MPRLTNAHKAAGITEISSLRNTSGSYVVKVKLDSIDRKSNGTNFRPFSGSHENQIRANFTKKAVRNPILVWTGSRLKSIDGRHTIAALQAKGFRVATAEVHFKMTQAEAASVFYELTQNSKRMGPWDAFAAALEGEYDFAKDIDKALAKYGFTTPNDDGYNRKSADFDGFTPLFDSWKLGFGFLDTFLTVLKVWKTGSRLQDKARINPFQRGLMDFLQENQGNYSASELAAMLGKREAYEIHERAVDQSGDDGRAERHHYKQAFEWVAQLGRQNRRRAA